MPDLAAVAVLAIAVALAFHQRRELRLLAWVLGAASLALTLAHRNRWLERSGGGICRVEEWWLVRPWRRRQTAVRPLQVVLRGPAKDGGGRGAVLSIGGQGTNAVIERWRESSQIPYAQQVARNLARWLDAPVLGTLAPGPDSLLPARLVLLRGSLASLARAPRPASSRVAYEIADGGHRLASRRWWIEPVWAWGRVAVGLGLMLLFSVPSAGFEQVALAVAVPAGVLLFIDGFRDGLPGRIVTRIGPDALVVERRGLAHDLRLHVAFSDITAAGIHVPQPATRRGSELLLARGDDEMTLALTGRLLGVAPADVPWVGALIFDSLDEWAGRRLGDDGGAPVSAAPGNNATVPLMSPFPEDRVRPRSALALLAARFPRFGTLLAVGFLFVALFGERAAGKRWGHVPNHVRFEIPILVPWLIVKAAATAASGLAALVMLAAAIRLEWSAPSFRGQVLAYLFIGISGLPTFEASFRGLDLVDAVNICWGDVAPARFPVEATDTTLRYGPHFYEAPARDSKAGVELGRFDQTKLHADDLLETKGWMGGLYLVVRKDYETACGCWHGRCLLSSPSPPL